jgi:hypothetical protein
MPLQEKIGEAKGSIAQSIAKKRMAKLRELQAPVPDDEQARIARMREYQRRFGRAGRQGTMLSAGLTLG